MKKSIRGAMDEVAAMFLGVVLVAAIVTGCIGFVLTNGEAKRCASACGEGRMLKFTEGVRGTEHPQDVCECKP